jgi:hypothetical protein
MNDQSKQPSPRTTARAPNLTCPTLQRAADEFANPTGYTCAAVQRTETVVSRRHLGPNAAAALLDDPEMFLHHVDLERRLAVFVRIRRDLLAATNTHNFDDVAPRYVADLDRLLDDAGCQPVRPLNFLFMTDFCGSTLLANALRRLRGVTCFFEVRAFAGLSLRKRALDRNQVAGATRASEMDDWQRALRLVVSAMSRSCRGDTVIVKEWPPTNYIISDILRCHDAVRAIFLYSDLVDYLNSVFRHHWRREHTRRRMLTELVETDLWPMIDRRKHLFSDGEVAAAHWFVQRQTFLRVDPAVLPAIRSLHNADFFEHPVETLLAVASHYGLAPDFEEAGNAFASVSSRHSKQWDTPYSMTARRRDIAVVAYTYRREIAEAVRQADIWMKAYPMPERLPRSLRVY